MIKVETVRKITKVVVGGSVWWTINNIIDNNVSPENRKQKIEVWLGSAAIGWVVSEQANLYIDRKFDRVIKAWKSKETEVKIEAETEQNLETKSL